MIRQLGIAVPQGPTQYQQLMERVPVQQAPPPPMAQTRVARPAMLPTKRNGPVEFTPDFAGHDGDNLRATLDKRSAKLMLFMAIAFLIFYLLLVSSKLLNDNAASARAAKSEHITYTEGVAAQISTTIDNTVIWINNGLSEGRTPGQSARLIAKSPGIDAALLVDAQGRVIAGYPKSASNLSNIKINNLADNKMQVTSLLDAQGHATPVIMLRNGKVYVLAALSDNTLINLKNQNQLNSVALITLNGRVIAGNNDIGLKGPQDGFHLNKEQFKRLSLADNHSVERTKLKGNKYQIASVGIENAPLVLLEARPITKTAIFQSNLLLFTIIFLGTCALIAVLLRSTFTQLKLAQRSQSLSEISRQRYQAAIDSDRGGIWEIDLTDNTVYLSASFASMVGLPHKEHTMITSKFLNLFHPEDREQFSTNIRRAQTKGEFDLDMRVALLPLILQCRGRLSTRAVREMRRVIVGVALDITATRGAQMRLSSAEARLRDALSSMTDSFAVWDSMNRLVVWNARFEDFFKFAPGVLQPGLEHATVEYYANQSLEQSLAGESEDITEMKLTDGRWLRYSATPTAEGGRVSIGSDITEIRARELDLKTNEVTLNNTVDVLKKSQKSIVELAERYEQEKIRAEEASQSKTDFLASMSHELRTPLNAINGFSDIMKKEMFGPLGDPRYKEYVSDILFSGQHLLTLINDILDMSKIEAGKMTLNTEMVSLNDMTEQVIRIMRGRAEDAQLKLEVSPALVREIESDPRAVKQVLLNLMTNAIKFTPQGGTVSVELVEKQTGIIIKVKDTGIGISQDNIDRLAKPFEQVVERSNKHKEGTGLGLALSKSLVELHGGVFKIESELGVGTTVIFSLPNTPIIKVEEPVQDNVSQEISKLAKDITKVIDNNGALDMAATPAELPPSAPQTVIDGAQQFAPYPYAQPVYPLPPTQNKPAA